MKLWTISGNAHFKLGMSSLSLLEGGDALPKLPAIFYVKEFLSCYCRGIVGRCPLLSALSTCRLLLFSRHEREHGLKPDTYDVRNERIRIYMKASVPRESETKTQTFQLRQPCYVERITSRVKCSQTQLLVFILLRGVLRSLS